MEAQMTLGEIMEQVRKLSQQERKELAKLLIDSLDVPEPEKSHSILEFAGIAAHLADDVDPQEYVNRIRGEWD
jgi:hypothetical protein